jgi:hypothetical protein
MTKEENMKRCLVLIIILLAVLSLSACMHTEQPSAEPTAAPEATAENTVSPASEGTAKPTALPTIRPYTHNAETDFDNRYSSQFTCIVELDNMFIWHDSHDGPFFFYEKETGFKGLLCNKPECDHKGADCNALSAAEPAVNYYDGKIYWLSPWPDFEKGYYQVYRMNVDSSDRELFMTVPYDSIDSAQYQRMFIHRGKMFFMNQYNKVIDGTPETRLVYSVCDFKTHNGEELKPIFELVNPGVFTDQLYFGGDDIYLMACCYYEEDYRLKIFRYNIVSEETDVVADIPADEDEFYPRSFRVSPEGEIYIGESIFDHIKEVKAYKVADNKLVPFMEFHDGVIDWSRIFVEEDVIIAVGCIERDPYRYAAWMKDYKGNTIFKGELTTNYKDELFGHFECNGNSYIGATKNRILAVYEEELYLGDVTKSYAVVFVEYDITQNGLEEKTLASWSYDLG